MREKQDSFRNPALPQIYYSLCDQDFSQSVYLVGDDLPEELRKAESQHFLGTIISKRKKKLGLASTKKTPSTSSESLNYQGREKSYSVPQHQQLRQNQWNSFHKYHKRN